MIDDSGAVIVTRYLSSFRSLSKSFDFYLLQVFCVVCMHASTIYIHIVYVTCVVVVVSGMELYVIL